MKNIINDFNTTEYILFLKALFTSSNLNSCSTKISSLDKFLISEYSTIIFITDSTIVNIITKDEIISEQIINNAKSINFKKYILKIIFCLIIYLNIINHIIFY